MTTEPEPRAFDWRWLILIGGTVLALGIGAVVWFNRAAPTAQPSSSSITVSTTAAPEPSSTEPPASPPSASATPSSSSTRKQSPYCKAFSTITAGGISTSSDDGGVDLDELSNKFAALIKKYSAAAAVAPASLEADYAKVLAYLRQGKRAVDSRDLDQIKALVKNLSSLNSTMESIQTESEALCR